MNDTSDTRVHIEHHWEWKDETKYWEDLPNELFSLKRDYQDDKLNEKDKQMAFVVFAAFALEKIDE
ncbi:MAG: hypothetical protein AAF483_17710 [Planctomycetota bacterium]